MEAAEDGRGDGCTCDLRVAEVARLLMIGERHARAVGGARGARQHVLTALEGVRDPVAPGGWKGVVEEPRGQGERAPLRRGVAKDLGAGRGPLRVRWGGLRVISG